jgi:hypothetical protein
LAYFISLLDNRSGKDWKREHPRDKDFETCQFHVVTVAKENYLGLVFHLEVNTEKRTRPKGIV